MQVRVLGCSGAIAKGCRTTSFLIDDDLLVDAGTGVGDLTLDEMAGIDDVLLTHSHLDHIAALPLMIDAVATRRGRALNVHAQPETIDALRRHVFNNVIWPDFTIIPSASAPFVCFHPIEVGSVLQLGSRTLKQIEVLSAVHTVPACGFAVRRADAAPHWVFSGDTERNPHFWDRVNALDVGMLVIETAFSDRELALAQRSRHHSPSSLAEELHRIDAGKRYPIYITHTKPAETGEIMSEIAAIAHADRWSEPVADAVPWDIRWLAANSVFEV